MIAIEWKQFNNLTLALGWLYYKKEWVGWMSHIERKFVYVQKYIGQRHWKGGVTSAGQMAYHIRIEFSTPGVYRIHIFPPEYEYILNIFSPLLAPKQSVQLCSGCMWLNIQIASSGLQRQNITLSRSSATFKLHTHCFDGTEWFNVRELAYLNQSNGRTLFSRCAR
jgi:hypothetical protein